MEEIALTATRFLETHVQAVWRGFLTMAESTNKIPRISTKIGTHSGVFHCDEALACFMLRQLPEYRDAEIVRTRNQEVLDGCDVVVDVGGVYDPKRCRYDHHQRGFEHTLSSVRPDLAKNKLIKLSSAGLIYAHYGIEIISEILSRNNFAATTDCLEHLYTSIYEGFVEELDAIDNGVPMYAEGRPKYRINTHLSARVHRLNPEWNAAEDTNADQLFEKAMEMVGKEFTERVLEVNKAAFIWWPAREVVKKAMLNSTKVHASGEIMELKARCPWKDHLFSLEEELGIVGKIKFVVFYDTTDSWRVQGVPVQPDSFVCRVFLHKDWWGIRDCDLSKVAGIEGCVFCHATGFIGGNKTRDGALEMAVRSLERVSYSDS